MFGIGVHVRFFVPLLDVLGNVSDPMVYILQCTIERLTAEYDLTSVDG